MPIVLFDNGISYLLVTKNQFFAPLFINILDTIRLVRLFPIKQIFIFFLILTTIIK